MEPHIATLFTTLVKAHGIDTQNYPNILEKYPTPNGYTLNYQSINNNQQYGKSVRKKPLYDYRIQNHLDLSKVFILPHMAHYTGFNETCDSSALLGLIMNSGQFQHYVTSVAERVRIAKYSWNNFKKCLRNLISIFIER